MAAHSDCLRSWLRRNRLLPNPPSVHIPTTGSDALSKEQKAFNRLSKRIGKLETEIGDFRTAATALRQRVQQEYRPLQQQHNDLRADFVRML